MYAPLLLLLELGKPVSVPLPLLLQLFTVLSDNARFEQICCMLIFKSF
jgi:hypothetical protein